MTEIHGKSNVYRHYPDTNVNITKVDCLTCNTPVIAELQSKSPTIYDFGPYLESSKVRHKHQADPRIRARVLGRVATNKRLLEDRDPDDFNYVPRREMN